MKTQILIAATAAVLCACETVPEPIVISAPYDIRTQTIGQYGDAHINGNAMLRMSDGSVRSCAGLPVQVVKVTPYSSARMMAVYGRTDRGLREAFKEAPNFAREEPGYAAAGRSAVCDTVGNFEIPNIPLGEYFIVTRIAWEGRYTNGYINHATVEGATLMQRVAINRPGNNRVVLSQ